MFYLYDIGTTKIKEAVKSLQGVPLNGSKFIYVPDDIAVNPGALNFDRDLILAKKWEGLLEKNPFYTNIISEDLLDATPWDLSESRNYGLGGGTTWINGSSTSANIPALQTNLYDISAGGPHDRFKVYWEVYSLVRVLDGDRVSVYYQPVQTDAVNVSLSFDGVSFGQLSFMQFVQDDATNSVLIKFESEANAPVPSAEVPGTTAIPTDTPVASANRYYIGSFAILY